MQLIVLVDYDNVKQERKERTAGDVDFNLELIVDAISRLRAASFPEYRDVRIRLYGGWTDINGALLEGALLVASAAGRVRGRRSGGRFTAELAVGLFDCEYSRLKGLYRDGGQKMVDTLIVSDAVRITLAYEAKVLIMSDDEDMLPGLLGCHIHNPKAVVKRRAKIDSWHNRDLVARSGLMTEWGS